MFIRGGCMHNNCPNRIRCDGVKVFYKHFNNLWALKFQLTIVISPAGKTQPFKAIIEAK